MRTIMSLKTCLIATSLLLGTLQTAQAEDHPGSEALAESQADSTPANVVQNRFFLKTGRLETSGMGGYVPNNPMVKRFVASLLGAYHFSETFAAEGAFLFSPDLGTNDLKGLTHTLVDIAHTGSGEASFQQPLDKMVMGATFAARWAPFYGKINVIGESVLNFDAYGVLGLGMLSLQQYYAIYDESVGQAPFTNLVTNEKKVVITPNFGLGFNFFLNQTMALKIDARSYFYVAKKPQYDGGPGAAAVTESRLYNNFVASVGLSFFIPEMKKRMYNF
jgi:outer membrane beta-barrel protein